MSTLLAPPPGETRSSAAPLTQLRVTALSGGARPVRFAAVGGVCALLQLIFLFAIKQTGMASLPANVAAYLLSAEINFYLSDAFIWHDRRGAGARGAAARWLAFHLSIAGTFLVSQIVFVAAAGVVHYLVASALGIGVAAVLNFAIQDRLTFRTTRRG